MAWILSLSLLTWALGGCEPALFPENLSRSPYDRYQQLRGEPRPATTTNAYGGEVPNLRARLRPLGEP